MLVGALGWVGVGDEGHVRIGEGFRCFAVVAVSWSPMYPRNSRSSDCRVLDLQVGPDINVPRRHLVRADENVSAVATSAINPDRVLAGVGSGAVEGDLPTLVAIRCVGSPRGLVPALLEAFRDLRNSKGRNCKRKKRSVAEHFGNSSRVVKERR